MNTLNGWVDLMSSSSTAHGTGFPARSRAYLRGVRGLVRELDLKHGLELPAHVEPLVRADV